MNVFLSTDFNAELTLTGGQSFLWRREDNDTFLAFHSSLCIELKKISKGYEANILWQSEERSLKEYFGNNAKNYQAIKRLRGRDVHLNKSVDILGDIRVLSQPFEDTLITFLISSNNNIKRIRNSVYDIALNYGKKIKTKYGAIHLFPDISILAQVQPDHLRQKVSVGYRAEYIASTSKEYLSVKDELHSLKEVALSERLKDFHGVGDKVADCISVFSGCAKTFSPIDVWAKRLIKELYGIEFKNYSKYRDWFCNEFNNDAALAGQYLFEYYRNAYD